MDPEPFLARGFTLVESTFDERAMGSSRTVLTDGVIDVHLFNDRGERGVVAGVHGDTAYVIDVWARALGLDPAGSPGAIDEQVAWTLDHLSDLHAASERDPALGERLRDLNWEGVKQALDLAPDADHRDPRTWKRQP
ncbi:hypothetical protein [Asanoa hainanensis]|uniref:hypothetical protein n=1 Tax=Asanoa hainanensis TaxID=560556 RepID=UPI00118142DC|nr:hypothetical protein [Asanoa hainanensis]